MAVNGRTLDSVERTHFYRRNKAGVPIKLTYDLVTIGGDFQAYEPLAGDIVNSKGQRLRGQSTGAVFLDNAECALPIPGRGARGQMAVWEYHGI